MNKMSHKFRSEFGKCRVVRDEEEVVVAFSGGLKSSALLHLLLEVACLPVAACCSGWVFVCGCVCGCVFVVTVCLWLCVCL